VAEAKKLQVIVCMGSSCFSRGNSRMLKLLQDSIKSCGAESRVQISGSLCEDQCTCGPNITINGNRLSAATPEKCIQLLQQHLHTQETPE
jgi:NADH:ubiquinone oxidoreductase subunit E